MKNKNIVAVIDLGTFHLKCAIFLLNENSVPQLIGFSKKKTQGIHNSIITNIKHAIKFYGNCKYSNYLAKLI